MIYSVDMYIHCEEPFFSQIVEYFICNELFMCVSCEINNKNQYFSTFSNI